MKLVELMVSGNFVEITSHPQLCQESALYGCWYGLAPMHNLREYLELCRYAPYVVSRTFRLRLCNLRQCVLQLGIVVQWMPIFLLKLRLSLVDIEILHFGELERF